jgi:predicted Rossmann fold nucleotide-binding protein DprA/Smf involved in DNA uptake
MVKRFKFYQHGDEMINSSLHYLRARTIREGRDGLEHIEAIMRIRGLDPEAVHVPRKNKRRFRNGALRAAVMSVLREGSYTSREIADRLECQRSSVHGCLRTLEAHGVVRREGQGWLAP